MSLSSRRTADMVDPSNPLTPQEMKLVMDGDKKWRDAAAEDARVAVVKGWLFKRGRYARSWSARFFVCRGNKLTYHLKAVERADAACRGSFLLQRGCTIDQITARPLPRGKQRQGSSGRNLFCFRLCGPTGPSSSTTRDMLLASQSEPEAITWRTHLLDRIRACATPTPPALPPHPLGAHGVSSSRERPPRTCQHVQRQTHTPGERVRLPTMLPPSLPVVVANATQPLAQFVPAPVCPAADAELQWRVVSVHNGVPVMVEVAPELKGGKRGVGAALTLATLCAYICTWLSLPAATRRHVQPHTFLLFNFDVDSQSLAPGYDFAEHMYAFLCVFTPVLALALLWLGWRRRQWRVPSQMKMEMVLEADPDDVFRLLHDHKRYAEWQDTIAFATIERRLNENADVLMLAFSGLWRFFTLNARLARVWDSDGDRRRLFFTSTESPKLSFVDWVLRCLNLRARVLQGGFTVIAALQGRGRSPKSLLIHSVQLSPHGLAHQVGIAQYLLREQMLRVLFGVRDELERRRSMRH